MLNFSPWKAWGICLLCLFGILLATLSFRPGPARAIDINQNPAGGTQLLLEADTGEVAEQSAEWMEDMLRGELRRNGVTVSQMQASNGEVSFLIDNPAQLRQAQTLARNQIGPVVNGGSPAWTVQVTDGRQIVMRQTEAGVNADIRQAMEVARGIIARRISALRTLEPTIVVQGVNRILVQVPGMQDPEALKRLIGRTARLEFKLVEVESLPCRAPRRPGVQYLPSDELPAGICMGVQTRSLLGNEQISDARQNFDETGRVSILVRFDVQGGQRFARVTQANVGRRFAIVLDNRIISAPVINEPILGGTASIAGSFTVESANQLAISLRSGRLPVELHVVDERSIGLNIRPDGAKAAND
jgi:preprotein translocase subunit SecD